ncbi:MAG: hypothetical protein ACKO2Z_17605 [Sphaerospermopsis kisseleviana]
MTDSCLKRKVRNYIQMLAPDEQEPERFKIFIRSGSPLGLPSRQSNNKIASCFFVGSK